MTVRGVAPERYVHNYVHAVGVHVPTLLACFDELNVHFFPPQDTGSKFTADKYSNWQLSVYEHSHPTGKPQWESFQDRFKAAEKS